MRNPVPPDLVLDDDAAVVALAKAHGWHDQLLEATQRFRAAPHQGKAAFQRLFLPHGVALLCHFTGFNEGENGWQFLFWLNRNNLPAIQQSVCLVEASYIASCRTFPAG